MSRRRIAQALMAAVGGTALAGAADAQERRRARRSTEEPEADYNRRTGERLLDPIETDGLRRSLQADLRGARARAVYDRNEGLRNQIGQEGVMAILRGDSHIRLSQARAAIDAIEQVDPAAARRYRAQLQRVSPPRDRNVDETPGAVAGGVLGAAGGLALSRGRGGGARRAVARALATGAMGAIGAGGGAAAQNASQGVLTDTDAGDIGTAAAGGAALALGARGARGLIARAARTAAVRAEQRAVARPDVNPRLPYFQREAAERRADETARRATRGARTDDASLLTPAIAHMERVIEAAGRDRRVTGRTSLDKLRAQVARAKSRGEFREAADALNREYSTVIEELGLSRAARLDLDQPEVVGARALRALEKRVRTAVASRAEMRAEIAAMRPAQVEAQIAVLEQARGRLTPDEAFTLRLLKERLSQGRRRPRRTTPTQPQRGEDRNPRYLQ